LQTILQFGLNQTTLWSSFFFEIVVQSGLKKLDQTTYKLV
jgi:hypothetical protein